MRRSLAGIVLAGLTACALTPDFDSFTAGTPKVDGGVSVSVPTPEAGVPEATTLGPPPGDAGALSSVVVARGVDSYGAGAAQKHHVHYAENLHVWTFFYETTTDRDHLFVKATSDFVTFVDGPPLALPRPHDNDGRNFDVAYASIAGADVFYVGYSTHDANRYSYVARGCSQNGTIMWGAPVSIGESDAVYAGIDPDAPAIAFIPGQKVALASGFNSLNGHYYDFDGFISQQADDGTVGFVPTFDSGTELEVAAQSVNARTIVSTATYTLGAWERGDVEPDPTELALASYGAGTWSAVSDSTLVKTSYDPNDWDVVADAANSRTHLVRWSTASGLEHKYYDTTVGAHAGYTIPTTPYASGEGLVTLDLTGGVTAFSLTETDHVLRQSQLQGTTWSAWTDLTAVDPTRHHISGGTQDGVAVVLWENVNADGSHDLAALKLQ